MITSPVRREPPFRLGYKRRDLHHALFTPHRQPTADDTPMLGSGWAQHVTQVSFFGDMAVTIDSLDQVVQNSRSEVG